MVAKLGVTHSLARSSDDSDIKDNDIKSKIQDSVSDVALIDFSHTRSSIYDINMTKLNKLTPVSYLIRAVKSLEQLRSDFNLKKIGVLVITCP